MRKLVSRLPLKQLRPASPWHDVLWDARFDVFETLEYKSFLDAQVFLTFKHRSLLSKELVGQYARLCMQQLMSLLQHRPVPFPILSNESVFLSQLNLRLFLEMIIDNAFDGSLRPNWDAMIQILHEVHSCPFIFIMNPLFVLSRSRHPEAISVSQILTKVQKL